MAARPTDAPPDLGDRGISPADESTPRPDPTRLTTQLVDRAVTAFGQVVDTRLAGMDRASELIASELEKLTAFFLREIARVEGGVRDNEAAVEQARHRDLLALREILETRLSGMDKATELLAASVNRVPGEIDALIGALRELLGARLDGMDIATKLLADNVVQIPTETDRAVAASSSLLQSAIRNVEATSREKFLAIEGTFASNALALTAALAAQKEAASEQNKSNTLAITKSEQAQKETVGANQAQTTTGLNALSANLGDLKERVVRLEAGGLARGDARTETRLNVGAVVGAVGLLVAILAIIASVFIAAR